MLEELKKEAVPNFKDGRCTEYISMAILCMARSCLKTLRATGPDRVPTEILRALPWSALRSIQMLIDRIFTCSQNYPEVWREVLISFMPKVPCVTTLSEGRYLVMQNAISRWYSPCVVILTGNIVQRSRLFHNLGIYGFQEARKTWEITSSLQTLAQHGDTWGKNESVYIVNADIKQAFDHCSLANVRKGLQHAHVPSYLQSALLAPLGGTICTVIVEGMETPGLHWDRCIRTGGPEGPLVFNLIIVAMWAEAIRSWDVKGMGYCAEGLYGSMRKELLISHFLWADNVYLVAGSAADLRSMVHDLTLPLFSFGMAWKASSLLFMSCGLAPR
eukprot:6692551-Pyramimonas_sp.AAC.1